MKNRVFVMLLAIICAGCGTGLNQNRLQNTKPKPTIVKVRDLSGVAEKQDSEKMHPTKENPAAASVDEKKATDTAEKTGVSTVTNKMLKDKADMLYKPNGQPVLRASDVAKTLQAEFSKDGNKLNAVAYDDANGTFTIVDTIACKAYDFENYAHPYYGTVSLPVAQSIQCDKDEAIRKNTKLEDFVQTCVIPSFNLQIGTRRVLCPSKDTMYECTLAKSADTAKKKLKIIPQLICCGVKKVDGSTTETAANKGVAISAILLDYFTWQDVVNHAIKEVMSKQNDCFQANTAKKASEIKQAFKDLETYNHLTGMVGDIIKKDNSGTALSSQSCKIINNYKKVYENAKGGHLHFEKSGTIEIGIADKTAVDTDIKADDSKGTLTLKVLVYAIDDEYIAHKSQPSEITIAGFKTEGQK